MSVTHYTRTTVYEVTRIDAGTDMIELAGIVQDHQGDDCSWEIQGGRLVLVREMESTTVKAPHHGK